MPRSPSRWLSYIAIIFWLALSVASAAQTRDEASVAGSAKAGRERLALVIGNSDYPGLQMRFPNALSDTSTVTAFLRRAGFTVDLEQNVTQAQFRQSVARFKEKAASSSVALIYFAGAGFELDRANVFLSIDEKPSTPSTPADFAGSVNVADLADAVRPASDVGILMLDAGRDHPFNSSSDRGFSLARPKEAAQENDVLIVYSSSSGQPAEEGIEKLSPFAEAVVQNILTPGLELAVFARRVATFVSKKTEGDQKPELFGDFAGREFYFIPSPTDLPRQLASSSDTLRISNQPRIALVIGNSDYNRDGDLNDLAPSAAFGAYLTDLQNPGNDAKDIRDALTEIGFDVNFVADADRDQLENAILAFGRTVKKAGTDAIVVVYYAGHGIQMGGSNFLMPVTSKMPDGDLENMVAGDAELLMSRVAVPINTITDRLQAPSLAGLNIVILDACRNNPWESRSRGSGGSRGLADLRLKLRRTIVAFATEPGATAPDGEGRNSPYTGALKAVIKTPGVGVRDMLDEVGQAVEVSTNGRQVPYLSASSTGRTCLAACGHQVLGEAKSVLR